MKCKIVHMLLMFIVLATALPLRGGSLESEGTVANEVARLTENEMIWGLMQVWAETKFNFAYFDQVPDLDWDKEVQRSIPKVLSAKDRIEYYQILRELVARLDDGHTLILPPEVINRAYDNPPVEFQMVEGKAVLSRVGDTREIRDAGLRPGLELLTVGDGIPVWDYFRENVAKYFQGGTEQWTKALGLSFLLNGPKDSTVNLQFRAPEGTLKEVELKRNSQNDDGSAFVHWMLGHQLPVEHRMIGDGLVYFRLPSFGSDKIVEEFNETFDLLDPAHIRGMILDIRLNNGGSSNNAYKIISKLIDGKIESSKWKTRKYLPAYRSWGQLEEWFEAKPGEISPSEGPTYTGPLVVLIGPHTVSAAEDFVVPLDYSNRALLIGSRTAGTTGNPLTVTLPGGGIFRVCTKRDSYPDGKEFVGIGIDPDIVVEPTQLDIFEGRDPALEKAVEVISNWKRYEHLINK
ncbi:S41 family peptidase [Acidobacteriota bacterium]